MADDPDPVSRALDAALDVDRSERPAGAIPPMPSSVRAWLQISGATVLLGVAAVVGLLSDAFSIWL